MVHTLRDTAILNPLRHLVLRMFPHPPLLSMIPMNHTQGILLVHGVFSCTYPKSIRPFAKTRNLQLAIAEYAP